MGNENEQQNIIIHSKKFHISKKWMIISVVIFVVLSVGGWFVASSMNLFASKQELTYKAISDANELATKGNVDGAKAAYDSAISKTNDNILKANLLTNKATVFYNEKNYDQALSIALEAEVLSPNESTAQFIANIYLLKDDKVNAIAYYKKTIELIDKTKESESNKEAYYQGIIDSLGGDK